MNILLWLVIAVAIIIVIFIFTILTLRLNSRLKETRWRTEEGDCEIGSPIEARYEWWKYKEGEREIGFESSWADIKNGMRIYTDGITVNSTVQEISLEEQKTVIPRMLKYFGLVRGWKILKLSYERTGKPPDHELLRSIDEKLMSIGYHRINTNEMKEFTWTKQ